MSQSPFIGYVGDADFHDGSILSVEQQDQTVRVRVRGASGKVFVIEFTGVCAVRANHPVGMLLYALSERRAPPPMRRFVFANWGDQSDAQMEVDAASFVVYDE